MNSTSALRRNDHERRVAQDAETTLRLGRVIARGDDNWLVQSGRDAAALRLRRAASCLLDPQVGDTVAWLPNPDRASSGWITLVLERSDAKRPTELTVAGDLHLRVAGQWKVASDSLQLDSGDAQVRVRDARIGFRAWRAVGELLEQTVQRTRWVGEEFSGVISHWFQHSQSHRRHTEGVELAQAGTLHLQAEQLARVEAPTVLTEGASLVKTRAAQIHFG